MNTTLAAVIIIIVILAVGAVAYQISQKQNTNKQPQTTSNTTGKTQTKNEATPPTTETTNPSTQTTSTSEAETDMEPCPCTTIWDTYDNIDTIITSPIIPEGLTKTEKWPILYQGIFYPVAYISVTYNLTMNTGWNLTLNVTWSMAVNQSFTAACKNENGVSYETFSNVIRVSYRMDWPGGYLKFTAYPYNASELSLGIMNWIPIFGAPDEGYWEYGILGGESDSPTGHVTWSCAAAKDPMNPSVFQNCGPAYQAKGDPEAILKTESLKILDDYLPNYPLFNLVPPEIFGDTLHGLSSIKTSYSENDMVSEVPDYDTYSYTITYLGKATLPGEGVSVDVWRVEFSTNPDMMHGYYILNNATLSPLEYVLTMRLDDTHIMTVEYHLNSLEFLHTWIKPYNT